MMSRSVAPPAAAEVAMPARRLCPAKMFGPWPTAVTRPWTLLSRQALMTVDIERRHFAQNSYCGGISAWLGPCRVDDREYFPERRDKPAECCE
jgi:hypothetical protein